jgi:hypothetical protein
MLCWLVARSWRCREGCWHQLHGDQRIIFSYYRDIIRKLLQNVSNKLPINKVSYAHLWVDGPNMIHAWLHLAYQPYRADLLLCDSINVATLKPQKVAPWMVWMTGLKDSPFYPFLYSPQAPTDILTSKKCLVLLKGVAININWMATWLGDNTRKSVASRDTQTSFWGRSIVTLTSAALELTDVKCVAKITVFYWLTGTVSMSMSSSTLGAVLIAPSFAMYSRVYLLKSQLKDQKHDKMFNWSVHYHYPVSRWYIAV